ncbi:hypothetical protein FHG87_006589 [Trinorchestia longiramus]|nr:hypothetical protein FHG87_006589 [Trinorchestia longiramus]
MTPVVLFIGLTVACAFSNVDDKVIQEYGSVALMRDCSGELIFKHYMKKRADIMYNREHVHKLSIKIRQVIRNSTCVLQQLGYTFIPLDHIQYLIGQAQMKFLSFSNCYNTGIVGECMKKQSRDKQLDYDFMSSQNIFGFASADEKMVSLMWRDMKQASFGPDSFFSNLLMQIEPQ